MRGHNGNSLNRETLASWRDGAPIGIKDFTPLALGVDSKRPATLDGWPSKPFDQN